ncbi:hypothetical protein ACFVUS_24840 [Nocardia sp. NPDC058058]|uniref:hypothetical protein n=1 Tax=Nocardia sp. NPDC058058 TaxID=3346317 RepID=UPI0036DF81CC
MVHKPIPVFGKCIGKGHAPARPGNVSAAQLTGAGSTPKGSHSSATAGAALETHNAAAAVEIRADLRLPGNDFILPLKFGERVAPA